MLKKHYLRGISAVIILSLLLLAFSGCRVHEEGPVVAPGELPTMGEAEFDIFANEIFVDYVTTDSLSLNYFVADPPSFGIEEIVPTLGEVMTLETIRRDREENLEYADRLGGFRYDFLRPDQQIIYDILVRALDIYNVISGNEDFAFYTGYIRPINGIQVQLPILLAEFNFRTEADIDIYFQLLEDTHRYFSDIIEFERERSRRGTFLSSNNVDSVLDHIESFLANRDDNFMILVFDDIIDGFGGLSEQQREHYKHRNQELVLGSFLPAYDYLADAMRELRGIGARNGGLVNLPDGPMYAQAYLQDRTDSDMTIKQMDFVLRKAMADTRSRLIASITANEQLGEMLFNNELGRIPFDTPENYIETLRDAISQDFPPLGPAQYVVREIHESLQEHMSPAFYLTPAVDSFFDNVIYLNSIELTDNLYLFKILAHEGFPGHLYQSVYFLQQSPHPSRNFLTGIGYTEGWATYSELQSHFFAGLNENEAELLLLSSEFDLLFMSRIDLGVNGLGWDIDMLAGFLHDMGIEDRDTAEEIFHSVTGVPFLHLPYSIGYLEMMSLRKSAERSLGGNFIPLEFHRFILNFGPAPFPLLSEHLRNWAS